MSLRILAWLVLSTTIFMACNKRSPDVVATRASADIVIATGQAPSPSAAVPSATAAPAAASNKGHAFVRHPPHSTNSDADGVDACTQVGGNYFSCGGAYDEEKDPVAKRYLWRIAMGNAAGESGYVHRGAPLSQGQMPHAEVPYMCDPKKPCGAKNEHGDLNGAGSCLARTYEAVLMHEVAAAKAAHAHACKCGPKEGAFPAYNGTPYLCDAAGKPAFIAPKMNAEEGRDIVDCAMCEPKRGPGACQREVERFSATDAALSAYVETRQVARCKTPNEGPNSWE